MMMRIVEIVFVFLLLTGSLAAQKADDILGRYLLPNGLEVEIYKQGGKYEGKIVALHNYKEGQTKDVNNPDKSMRDKPLMNMVIIRGLEYDNDEKQWLNGTMYGPDKGINLNLKITELRDGEIEVVGSKYLFWKTLTWKKLKI